MSITLGSDSYRQTALSEALSPAKLQTFANLTWLNRRQLSSFPKRKVGYLKDGYEANFLVLTSNPRRRSQRRRRK